MPDDLLMPGSVAEYDDMVRQALSDEAFNRRYRSGATGQSRSATHIPIVPAKSWSYWACWMAPMCPALPGVQSMYYRLRDRVWHRSVLYDAYLFVRYRLERLVWEFKGRPFPTPPLVKQQCVLAHQRQFNLPVLIETGTYRGAMVRATRRAFREIYSIELSPKYYQRALHLFAPFPHIHLLQGDSAIVLGEVLLRINQSCLFWLDAHYSGEDTACGVHETPILAELDGILAHPIKQHVILIDDARLFDGEHAYPVLEKLTGYVLERRPEWQVSVARDIIRITPREASHKA